MRSYQKNHTRLVVASIAAFAMTLMLVLAIPASAPVNPVRSSVLLAQADEDVFEEGEYEEDEMTLEEELKFLEEAEKELSTLQKSVKGFKASVTRVEKKYNKKSVISVYEKMQDALQPVCAYRDAYVESIEGKCEVLGDYIESYDKIDVKKVILPRIRNFVRTFNADFFAGAQEEINDYRTELRESMEDEEDEEEED